MTNNMSLIGTLMNIGIFLIMIVVLVYTLISLLKAEDTTDDKDDEFKNKIGIMKDKNQNNRSIMNNSNSNDTKTYGISGSTIRFADVAGLTEAKEEVKRYVDIMRNRDKYLNMGAKLPKGFLMVGPPGCGKTLLAKAIAGEAGVNFISVNGSEFDEMYVGVGASRVRSLFKKARDNSPCIVFIDEIDGIGAKRGQHDNREHDKTLNNLLTEMDGFTERDEILCIGATNRIDILDSALTRSGRFDQHIVIDPPSVDNRYELFMLYFKKLKFKDGINLDLIARDMARMTPGVSGADIANICNQSAILAVSNNSEYVTIDNLKSAIEDVCIGGQRKSRKVSDKERQIVAHHEAGHAILGYLLKNTSPPLTISIIPRGAGNLGYTLPDYDDKMLKTKQEMIEEISALLGGTIAEKIFFDDITGGASNDIEKATQIAYTMCTQYGMSNKLGKIQIAFQKNNTTSGGYKTSQETMAKVDNVVKKLIDDIYTISTEIMKDHKTYVERLAKYLLEHEELKKDKTMELLGTNIYKSISLSEIDF